MIDIFCIASGPSLTEKDCEKVWHSGSKILAVNNSWLMFPSLDYIYAGDRKWWEIYNKRINVNAEKWTCSKAAALDLGINYHKADSGPFNSGMRAIEWAIEKGFKKIALLGYDCSLENGVHWHGEHDASVLKNPTDLKINRWHPQFRKVAEKAEKFGIEIVNCSRYTELGCFKIARLEDVIK